MNILVCNDDGIDSPFLEPTVKALAKIGNIKIVVPAHEQSWIGRAYSRHRVLEHKKVDFHGYECYTINGTPSDCVNIALEHFYGAKMPDVVFSGINIGYNVSLPLLFSSGTFAAAVEGAGRLIPSFAVSLELKHEYYQLCRIEHTTNDSLDECIGLVSEVAAEFIENAMQNFRPKRGEVYNLNFPSQYRKGDSILMCEPSKVPTRSLYIKDGDKYKFSYKVAQEFKSDVLTDLDCLMSSRAAYSKINVFSSGR